MNITAPVLTGLSALWAVLIWAVFRLGTITERRRTEKEAERIRRILASDPHAHKGPANMDQPPSHIGAVRFRGNRLHR